MHVIKAIELKSPVERHGIWKMGSWQPELTKLINVCLASINQNDTLLKSLFVIQSK